MVAEKNVFISSDQPFGASANPPSADPSLDHPPNDDSSPRDDEGPRNEGSDDATGYSQEEEESFEKETLPEVPEPTSSR